MNDKDTNLIGCIPCLQGMQLEYVPYKNSIIDKCENCGCRVWVGPASQEKRVKDGLAIWCMNCIAKTNPDINNIISLTNKKMGE